MQKINTNKPKIFTWGDEKSPERIRPSTPLSQIQQAANILNPISMLDNLFGSGNRESYPQQERPPEQAPKRTQETLVFSYRAEYESYQERATRGEIKQIVEKLNEQVTLLEKSESGLASDIAKIKVEQLPRKSGIYYLRFFEWLIITIKQLRTKVEEGRTWLQAFSSKKKKLGYWKMYKKHGTTFGLSHERTLATQSG